MFDNKIFNNDSLNLDSPIKNNSNMNNNGLNPVDLIMDTIATGIIRLEFKKLNNLYRFNNDSNFNNNLKSNQNDYTLDNYNPEIKNGDDYDKNYNKDYDKDYNNNFINKNDL